MPKRNTKENCWEFMKCGRQPEGDKVEELGVCPAALEDRLDDVHNGVNGGRACWMIAGTLCDGKVQGTFAEKAGDCLRCIFYKKVGQEEMENFELRSALKERLKSPGRKQLKLNCWEVKKCGREPSGKHANDLGVCPAATEKRLDGVHGGLSAGRACWLVAGTLCEGEVQGRFADKQKGCEKCDFYDRVYNEEWPKFKLAVSLLPKLKKN